MKAYYSKKDIFSRLIVFNKINKNARLNIFKNACFNNFRYIKLPNSRQTILQKQIINLSSLREQTSSEEKIEKLNINLDYGSEINSINYIKKIFHAYNVIKSCKLKNWELSVVLNMWLVRHNLCPFLFYAFDRWQKISYKNYQQSIFSIIELSTSYLYRLAATNNTTAMCGVHFADGSHNSLFIHAKLKKIEKIPRTLGAKYFINNQEVETTKLLLNSPLNVYLPNLLGYNKHSKIIYRQYIKGKTGHELLTSNFFSNKKAIQDLEKFFIIYKQVRKKVKINLDVHPGNFVWSEESQKWFFVDAGPIPLIGSDYFPLNSFDKYFKKIWLERHRRIKEMPVRSVDFFKLKI